MAKSRKVSKQRLLISFAVEMLTTGSGSHILQPLQTVIVQPSLQHQTHCVTSGILSAKLKRDCEHMPSGAKNMFPLGVLRR